LLPPSDLSGTGLIELRLVTYAIRAAVDLARTVAAEDGHGYTSHDALLGPARFVDLKVSWT
jgi:hypothetical protein